MRGWLARAWRSARDGAEPAQREPDETADLARAARLLLVRSRRTSGAITGVYTTAFRGGGVEFEELRPYVPGDDLRTLDWNATARTGEPWVKRFREERDQTLLLLVDVSASMGFGSQRAPKAAAAVRAAGVLASAAAHARDRVGLVLFDETVREEIAPARGDAHVRRLVRALVSAGRAPAGGTGLAQALARARAHALGRRRSIVFLVSDLRDDALLDRSAPGQRTPAQEPPRSLAHAPTRPLAGGLAGELAAAAKRHDLVAAVVHDPREDALPDVGSVRVADPEAPGATRILRTGSPRVREAYRAAAEARRRAVERRLRGCGADVLWLPTSADPVRGLARFFRERTGRIRVSP